MEFTLIDETRSHVIDATVQNGRVLLTPETIRDALGWSLEERGLCRGDECVPVRDRGALVGSEGIDLEALARTLDRPLALDETTRFIFDDGTSVNVVQYTLRPVPAASAWGLLVLALMITCAGTVVLRRRAF